MSMFSPLQAFNYPSAPPWQGQRLHPAQPYPPHQRMQPRPPPGTQWQRIAPPPVMAPHVPVPVPVVKPVMEVSLNQASGYLLQPLVYTIRILSDVNLANIDITMPRIDGASVEQLDGPKAFRRGDQGRNITTQIRYAITPFKIGDVPIPKARIKLKTRSGTFANTTLKLESAALAMNVLPANKSVTPWLPLADLRISGRHNASQQMKVGDPFTLTFTMSAKGMTGDQLPSISGLLHSDDFKFYPEPPRTSQALDFSGKHLTGKRVESFTVIPQRAGALSLPVLDIPYLDTQRHRRARAVWSGMHMNATGGDVLDQSGNPVHSSFFKDDYRQGHDLKFFWLPMLVLLLLTGVLAWWMSQGRPGYGESRERLSENAQWQRVTWSRRLLEFSARARLWIAKPLAFAHRSHTVRHITEQASTSYRVWQCLHCVGEADDARGLCRILRRFASDCLDIPANSSLDAVVDALHKIRPKLSQKDMRTLFNQLDSAAYGAEKIDIPSWKRRFRSLLRGVVFSRRMRCKEREAQRKLPDLNPQL